jgi:heat shock protein HtpX
MPELVQAVKILAERASLLHTPSLYYVPSSSLNAFTTGTANESAIAVTDGLLRRLNLRELAGVLAHEISHIANRDLRVMSLADTVSRLTTLLSHLGLLLLFFTIPLWLVGVVKISLLAVAILITAPLLSALLQAALSRTREFAADIGAAELTGDPRGLASALVKIDNPYGRWWQRIFQPQGGESGPSSLRTHPPTEERVERLLSLAPTIYQEQRESYPGTILPNIRYITITRSPRRHWSGLWY